MSCEIRVVATINDIPAIRRCLFPTDDLRGTDSWLQSCKISVSPIGDLIVISNERRLVILQSKWDSETSISQFQIIYSGSVHESDNIKDVLCLPIVNQAKSSHVTLDWTCVLLGFESGFIRFYTENCDLLIEEQLHNEVISSIKCQSQHNPRPDISPELHPEEIYVQYQSNVCVIAGGDLFPILRTLRLELAKVQAKGEHIDLIQQQQQQGNIIPKKWGFQDQAIINDISVVGVNLHQTFDHLLTASTCGGFDTKYRSSAPYNNLVLAVGSRPFIGFHYALEGCAQPVFSDVAKAVATKLKSALPGWLTGNNKSSVEKQPTIAMQPTDPMGCRFGLSDLRRQCLNIILTQDHKLAAITDSLGRILLLDAYRGIVLKMFKGYRDAQCAFIQMPDERHKKHHYGNKIATFLIIYSIKKGTLEIFTIQQGVKITTFTASKCSRLIYNNYNLLGFNITTKSRFICQFTTLLIDNDGKIKEILVPFHFALVNDEANNKKARDIHLFKKLKQLLKYGELDEDKYQKIYDICLELQTIEYKLQTLEYLLTNKEIIVEILLKCVQYFCENHDNDDNLKLVAQNSLNLLNLYVFLSNLKDANDSMVDDGIKLNLDTKDLGNLQKLLDLTTINDNATNRVEFVDNNRLLPSDFLSIFDLKTQLSLKPNLDEIVCYTAAEFIFKQTINGHYNNFNCLQNELIKTQINLKDGFYLLINYWVNHPLENHVNLEKQMKRFLTIIIKLINIQDDCCNDERFWCEIREILTNSPKPFAALIAAILFRIVLKNIENHDDDDLEILTQEMIEWSLLIGKLEDISLLNIILSKHIVVKHSKLPKLKFDKFEISLRQILQNGRGCVGEFVSKWLTIYGIDPEYLIYNDLMLLKQQQQSNDFSNDDDGDQDLLLDALPEQDLSPELVEIVENEEIFKLLNLLKLQFPYSLDTDCLLANMCWEYALIWQKSIQDLPQLEACINCLKAVRNLLIKQGLHNLVWNIHLKYLFETTCKLINKVGKLPKERLCKQDTGFSENDLPIFLGICTDFLANFLETLKECCYNRNNRPHLQYEPIWDGHDDLQQSHQQQQPLVELALQQNQINYDLLHLHHQLSLTLQMITILSIKHAKPINTLFESYMLSLFFRDFRQSPHEDININWNYADLKVQQSRQQFLYKTIKSTIESIQYNCDDNKYYCREHVRWMSKIDELSRLWHLNLDDIYCYRLINIYLNGFDSLGDEFFNTVNDRRKLGPELLQIAGKRLQQYLATSTNLPKLMAVLTTAVTRYMDELDKEWCAPTNLAQIHHLAQRCLLCFADDDDHHKYERRIAEMIIDGCETIEQLDC